MLAPQDAKNDAAKQGVVGPDETGEASGAEGKPDMVHRQEGTSTDLESSRAELSGGSSEGSRPHGASWYELAELVEVQSTRLALK